LAVYHQGGQVRTLESSYTTADPTVTLTKVLPPTFSPGKRVTICGSSLQNVLLAKRSQRTATDTTASAMDVVEIGTESFFAPATNVEAPPTGHKLPFGAGQPLQRGYLPDTRGFSATVIPAAAMSGQTPPTTVSGTLRVATRNASQTA